MEAARPTATLLREPVAGSVPGTISPELALVDPELAAWARARLPDIPAARLVVVAPPPPSQSERAAQREATSVVAAGALAGIWPRTRLVSVAAALLLGIGVASGFLLRPVVVRDLAAPSALTSTPMVERAGAEPSPPATRPRQVTPPAPKAPARRRTVARPPADLPDLVWPPVPGADGYRISLFRSGRLVYSTVRRSTHLRLTRNWVFRGRRYTLSAGSYRWVVWPLERRGGRSSVTRAIVDASLRI